MTDHFALMQEPRRPWLDPEELKTKFLEQSARLHPDRFPHGNAAEKEDANRRFAEFNAAYQCLREPKERLLHLLQLELGTRPRDVQRIPPGTMDLFVEVGHLCEDVDAFLTQKAQTTSPLLKVQYLEKGLEWTNHLNALQQKIAEQRDRLLDETKEMNRQWDSVQLNAVGRAGKLPLERLDQICRSLSYIGRWTEQIQERLLQLTLE